MKEEVIKRALKVAIKCAPYRDNEFISELIAICGGIDEYREYMGYK